MCVMSLSLGPRWKMDVVLSPRSVVTRLRVSSFLYTDYRVIMKINGCEVGPRGTEVSGFFKEENEIFLEEEVPVGERDGEWDLKVVCFFFGEDYAREMVQEKRKSYLSKFSFYKLPVKLSREEFGPV